MLLLVGCQTTVSPQTTEPSQVTALTQGAQIYQQYCAACHGANLEGEPDWQQPRADDSLRTPPHDETGHTWHHGDQYLFERTKYGAASLPPNWASLSSMPAYEGILTDAEIMAVIEYIKESWPPDIQARQQEITAVE